MLIYIFDICYYFVPQKNCSALTFSIIAWDRCHLFLPNLKGEKCFVLLWVFLLVCFFGLFYYWEVEYLSVLFCPFIFFLFWIAWPWNFVHFSIGMLVLSLQILKGLFLLVILTSVVLQILFSVWHLSFDLVYGSLFFAMQNFRFYIITVYHKLFLLVLGFVALWERHFAT